MSEKRRKAKSKRTTACKETKHGNAKQKKSAQKKCGTYILHVDRTLLVCIVLVLCAFLLVITRNDKKEISNLADETLDFIESVCQRYDGYTAGTKATALKEVYDKTAGLTQFASEKTLEDESFLYDFAQRMELSGILVTDGNAKLVAQVDMNGKDQSDEWADFLENNNKKDIVQNPKKTFCAEVRIGKNDYYVALMARPDAEGLVLCYKDTEIVDTDLYEPSLENTFTNNTFHKNPRIVITDGEVVVASNNDFLAQGTDISNGLFATVGSRNWEEGKLIRLLWDQNLWYGKREVYGRYYIYLFYPAMEVFTNMLPIIAIFAAVYAALSLVLVLLRSYSEHKHLEKERHQLGTIRAISSLYVSTFILHLKENVFEGIKLTERSQSIVEKSTQPKEVARLLAERIIAPNDRKRYMEFLDFDTMKERLDGHKNLGDIFQDVNGVWFSVFLVPMEYDEDGQLTEVLFASRNINEYKQKEEQYKEELRKTASDAQIANAAKSSFLRRMSHDIRTPINGIRGMALLAQKSLDDPQKTNDCMEKILFSSNYLQELLDDILRLSKLESGKTFFEEKPFDLRKLIHDTARFSKELANEKNVQFSFDLSGIEHPYVIASPLHLRQVMQNILTNAVKFNRIGGRVDVICTESKHTESGKMWFEFICSDTGIGIGKEFQKSIFEPFSQEQDSARSSYAGAGLGLPIVKEILEQRGGSISFTSEKNEGTTFHIKVPLQIDPNAEKHEEETLETETKAKIVSLDGIRVLIAEDNAINMEIAKELLADRGAIITPAVDGQEAVELFAGSKPDTFDVILMDIMMPRLNGLDATKAIRAMNRPDAAHIPIFAMTANAFVEDVRNSRAAGMNEHLSKPLDMDLVIRLISRYCQDKKKKGNRLQN